MIRDKGWEGAQKHKDFSLNVPLAYDRERERERGRGGERNRQTEYFLPHKK